MPDWIEVNTDDLTIMLRLDQFRMQNGMYIKADKIDLVNDDIRFSLYCQKIPLMLQATQIQTKLATAVLKARQKRTKKHQRVVLEEE